ncbi:MAG: class I SAM-dependent methyltransferase [Gammaproteobacteria bacterium]|nr:class I SAM-dependent methyltransferase [Gammaproteobacteria bacterium]
MDTTVPTVVPIEEDRLVTDAVEARLAAILAGAHRSEAHRARDRYRNPAATLSFFGLQPDMTVVEIWPGAQGWYTEIIAPFVNEAGQYYAAHFDPDSEREFAQRALAAFRDKLAADPELYGNARMTALGCPDTLEIAPAGSADLVVAFRSLHNWMGAECTDAALGAIYTALRPGGVLGLVGHRGRADEPQDPRAPRGYVRQDYAIELVEAAGFELVASSEINANPRDTADHPRGVWTLPPMLALGDEDRERYLEIGESDRFTLKFRRPE